MQSKPKPAAKRAAGRTNSAAAQASSRRSSSSEIEQAEAALRAVEDELADPAAWATPARSAESTARHEAAKRAVDELYAYEQVAASAGDRAVGALVSAATAWVLAAAPRSG